MKREQDIKKVSWEELPGLLSVVSQQDREKVFSKGVAIRYRPDAAEQLPDNKLIEEYSDGSKKVVDAGSPKVVQRV